MRVVASTPIVTPSLPPSHDQLRLTQAALYSLGILQDYASITGSMNPQTQAALRALAEPMCAARAQIAALPPRSQQTFHLLADLSDSARTRLYVLDAHDQPVASFLISPGRPPYPTLGDRFTIAAVLPRQAWTPPKSAWAVTLKPQPPGLDNPMGVLKLSLGAHGQFIHGVPASEMSALGRAASHGCLRMSNANVLELHERYARLGTRVTVNRDPSEGRRLATLIAPRSLDAGREYLFGYVSGALGSLKE